MEGLSFSTSEVATAKDINYWAGFYSEWSFSLIIIFPLLIILSPLFLLFSAYRLIQLKRLRSRNSQIVKVQRSHKFKRLLPFELKRELADRPDLLAIAKLRNSCHSLIGCIALSGAAFIAGLWFVWSIGYDNLVETVKAFQSAWLSARDL